MVVGLVRDVRDGRRDNSIGELMRSVLPVLMPLVGAGLLTAIGVTVALTAVGKGISDDPILDVVFYALASTVTAPIEALVASVLYFRLLELNRPSSASAAVESPPVAS
jgi:hypothetical protein